MLSEIDQFEGIKVSGDKIGQEEYEMFWRAVRVLCEDFQPDS